MLSVQSHQRDTVATDSGGCNVRQTGNGQHLELRLKHGQQDYELLPCGSSTAALHEGTQSLPGYRGTEKRFWAFRAYLGVHLAFGLAPGSNLRSAKARLCRRSGDKVPKTQGLRGVGQATAGETTGVSESARLRRAGSWLA